MEMITAIFVLLLAPFIMLVMRLLRARIGYLWLTALMGVLAAEVLVLFSKSAIPQTSVIPALGSRELISFSPTLLLDEISWVYGLAIVTLILAILLTVAVRRQALSWRAWASSLTMAACGLFAITANDPLTLLLAWSALDLVELLILIIVVEQHEIHTQGITAFAARLAGSALMLIAELQARTNGESFTLISIPTNISPIVLVAAAMRLGVLPLHVPFFEEPAIRRGLGTSLRLIPAAASLVIVTRTADAGVPEKWLNLPMQNLLFALVGISALYGAFRWATATDELAGRPFWILGLASFSVAEAIQGRPTASLAWSLACILSGGLIFLFSARNRFLLPLPIIGLLGLTAVPFSPTSTVVLSLTSPAGALVILFWLAHGLLLYGYAHFPMRTIDTPDSSHRGFQVVYVLGLALLATTHWGIGWTQGVRFKPDWWWSLIPIGIAATIGIWNRKGTHIPQNIIFLGARVFSLSWLYRLFAMLYRGLGFTIERISRVLEGDGGLLWTVILIILFTSWLLTIRGGVP